MEKRKKDRLAAAGWKVGNAADFLELSAEEAAFVELKLALADYLRQVRTERGLSQEEVARRLGSSQSRVAKMEAADASVSVDLLVKSLLLLGASRGEVGRVIARAAQQGDRAGRITAAHGRSCWPSVRSRGFRGNLIAGVRLGAVATGVRSCSSATRSTHPTRQAQERLPKMNPGPGQSKAADEAAVRAVEAAYDAAWNAGDLASLLQLVTDRVVVINPYGEITAGRDAVETSFTALFDGVARGSKHTSQIRAIHFVAPDIALVDAEAVISDFGPGPEPLRHAFTDVLMRTAEGWRIDHVRAYVFIPRPPS